MRLLYIPAKDLYTRKAHHALFILPNRGEIIKDLAYLYETTGDSERAAALWAKLYQMQRIPPGLLDYNYNMLQSTMPDAILFTNGDNDTYPALTLQRAQKVREDVLVVNRLNTNYTFPFILLAEHYQQSGEETRAKRWRELAMDIARPYPYLSQELQKRANK